MGDGYCVLVLAYFGTPSLPEHLREVPLEYFGTAFRWLAAQDQVVPDDYELIGGSRGGELALLVASRDPQVRAVVAIDPSSVLFPSPPTGVFDAIGRHHAAWTQNGQALPFVQVPLSFAAISGLIAGKQRGMLELALAKGLAADDAAIPVERINGPLLCISNLRDEIWPSSVMCDQTEDRLSRRAHRFAFERISFDETHYTCRVETCWATILRFLDQHFGSAP